MTLISRRTLVGSAVAAGLAASLDKGVAHAVTAATRRPFRVALSVSPFSERVLAAGPLRDGSTTARTTNELQRLYNRRGATEVYQRIAGNRLSPQNFAEHGWERGLERARLARALGMPFNPEIGIFANYGDVASYQEPPSFVDFPGIDLPGPWLSLTIDQMLPPLRRYGAAIARKVLATGVTVNFWDIGNEVEFGVAGVTPRPIGGGERYAAPDKVDPAIGRMTATDLFAMRETDRIAWCRTHLWPHTARLLGAVADGIRSVDRRARFSTHISSGSQPTVAVPVAFWLTLRDHGYLPDQLGQSVWGTQGAGHGGPEDTFAWVRSAATELKRRLGRPMFLAEFGFPSGRMPPPFDWNDRQKDYDFDERGQHDYVRDIAHWGARTGMISGIRPWAPDYWIDNGWANMSFFRKAADGAVAKPVLGAIQEGLRLAAAETKQP